MALSAASPFYRGYVSDIDCRWGVISASVDDRTGEERGLEVSRWIRKNWLLIKETWLSQTRPTRLLLVASAGWMEDSDSVRLRQALLISLLISWCSIMLARTGSVICLLCSLKCQEVFQTSLSMCMEMCFLCSLWKPTNFESWNPDMIQSTATSPAVAIGTMT